MIDENNGIHKYRKFSFEISRGVTKHYSTSFYSATQLFPQPLRDAIFSIYGFVRLADEIVDSFHNKNQRLLLNRFEEELDFALQHGISSNPVIHSFLLTVNTYSIDDAFIRSFLTSMRADLEKKVYVTSTEADQYIYGSADVVGLMCLRVFCEGDNKLFEELRVPAGRLGSAFQKVNFLRDLREDVLELGRIYFPEFNMDNFDENIKLKLVQDIMGDFEEALVGIKRLPDSSRLAVYTAYRYYMKLLSKIRQTPASELLKRRIRVPNSEKLRLLSGAVIKHKLRIQIV